MPARMGAVLTPEGWRRGHLVFGERIEAIDGVPAEPEPPYLLPGCVDLHVHGGGGADTMQGEAAIRRMLATHALHGTTSLLATTVTAPVGEIEAALAAVSAVRGAPAAGEAALLGAHLEGPFLNPDRLGAQPPFALAADPERLRGWCATGIVRVVTLAPEIDPAGRLAAVLGAQGVRAQLGHSLCSHAEARAALASGFGVTHLYNAMSGLDHRAPGAVGAALAHAEWAEIIPDLVHVEATAILAARRCIPNLYGVTDATAGAGMPDGRYPLGRLVATRRDGAMRLDDGTLAGSCLTMDQALRNLVALGLPLAEAARRLAALPARWLGLDDRGEIVRGRRADLVELDGDLHVQGVWVGGDRIR